MAEFLAAAAAARITFAPLAPALAVDKSSSGVFSTIKSMDPVKRKISSGKNMFQK